MKISTNLRDSQHTHFPVLFHTHIYTHARILSDTILLAFTSPRATFEIWNLSLSLSHTRERTGAWRQVGSVLSGPRELYPLPVYSSLSLSLAAAAALLAIFRLTGKDLKLLITIYASEFSSLLWHTRDTYYKRTRNTRSSFIYFTFFTSCRYTRNAARPAAESNDKQATFVTPDGGGVSSP